MVDKSTTFAACYDNSQIRIMLNWTSFPSPKLVYSLNSSSSQSQSDSSLSPCGGHPCLCLFPHAQAQLLMIKSASSLPDKRCWAFTHTVPSAFTFSFSLVILAEKSLWGWMQNLRRVMFIITITIISKTGNPIQTVLNKWTLLANRRGRPRLASGEVWFRVPMMWPRSSFYLHFLLFFLAAHSNF